MRQLLRRSYEKQIPIRIQRLIGQPQNILGKAEQLVAEGHPIRIIYEADFKALVRRNQESEA